MTAPGARRRRRLRAVVFAVLAALLLATGCGSGAPAAPTTSAADRIRDITVPSKALGSDAQVRLLLPASFDAHPERRYPVLYLLHGCCDTYDSWTRSTDVEELTADSDVLVVMPDGGRVGFYSDWKDGTAWEQFHVEELGQLLERDYRASDVRAIGGLSMGGLGALAYAARHPGTFRAAASYSGVVHTRLTLQESRGIQDLVRAEGEDPAGLWGDPERDAKAWAAHNPYDLAPRLKGTLLFLSVGNGSPGPLDPADAPFSGTESALQQQNVAFAERLEQLGVDAELSFYGRGTHDWPSWQRELRRSWPMFQRALGLG